MSIYLPLNHLFLPWDSHLAFKNFSSRIKIFISRSNSRWTFCKFTSFISCGWSNMYRAKLNNLPKTSHLLSSLSPLFVPPFFLFPRTKPQSYAIPYALTSTTMNYYLNNVILNSKIFPTLSLSFLFNTTLVLHTLY